MGRFVPRSQTGRAISYFFDATSKVANGTGIARSATKRDEAWRSAAHNFAPVCGPRAPTSVGGGGQDSTRSARSPVGPGTDAKRQRTAFPEQLAQKVPREKLPSEGRDSGANSLRRLSRFSRLSRQ
jgi:hypothetical protein